MVNENKVKEKEIALIKRLNPVFNNFALLKPRSHREGENSIRLIPKTSYKEKTYYLHDKKNESLFQKDYIGEYLFALIESHHESDDKRYIKKIKLVSTKILNDLIIALKGKIFEDLSFDLPNQYHMIKNDFLHNIQFLIKSIYIANNNLLLMGGVDFTSVKESKCFTERQKEKFEKKQETENQLRMALSTNRKKLPVHEIPGTDYSYILTNTREKKFFPTGRNGRFISPYSSIHGKLLELSRTEDEILYGSINGSFRNNNGLIEIEFFLPQSGSLVVDKKYCNKLQKTFFEFVSEELTKLKSSKSNDKLLELSKTKEEVIGGLIYGRFQYMNSSGDIELSLFDNPLAIDKKYLNKLQKIFSKLINEELEKIKKRKELFTQSEKFK